MQGNNRRQMLYRQKLGIMSFPEVFMVKTFLSMQAEKNKDTIIHLELIKIK